MLLRRRTVSWYRHRLDQRVFFPHEARRGDVERHPSVHVFALEQWRQANETVRLLLSLMIQTFGLLVTADSAVIAMVGLRPRCRMIRQTADSGKGGGLS
jgi:hypothetical protein